MFFWFVFCGVFQGERSLCIQDSSSRNSRTIEKIQCKTKTKGKLNVVLKQYYYTAQILCDT